ncbi:MAG: sensor domain-containing diguanylate cyclase [Deltaproteobacteria bacterium]|nr:sensor domain-containing diguanylate cyclase [Deltaproteobacteria bacterium]
MRNEESRDKYQKTVASLYEITRVINSGRDLEYVLRYVSKEIVSLLNAETASIMLLDETGTELLSKASFGLTPEEERYITFKVGEGVAGWVVSSGESALIDDVTQDKRFKTSEHQVTVISSLLAVPLKIHNNIIGVLTATHSRKNAFDIQDETILTLLGNSIVLDIENARLYRLSITDPLTKVYNRQFLYNKLPEEISRFSRYKTPLSIILFDVDYFKKFNDTYGHDAGDCILRNLALTVKNNIRATDLLIRYGGEEFLILSTESTLDEAFAIAERIRKEIENTDFYFDNKTFKITISLGVSQYRTGLTPEEFIKCADKALYIAKQKGRNRAEKIIE